VRARRLLVFAVLLAGACAGPVQWEKEGASQATRDQDAKDCNQQARLKAAEVLTAPPLPDPGMIGAPMRGQEQYALREAREFQICMQAKGYEAKR
jgi:hypothetical protein